MSSDQIVEVAQFHTHAAHLESAEIIDLGDGWIALNLIGANSIASLRIIVATAPFTEVTMVEPG